MPTEFEVQSVTTGVRAGRLRKSWGEEPRVRGTRGVVGCWSIASLPIGSVEYRALGLIWPDEVEIPNYREFASDSSGWYWYDFCFRLLRYHRATSLGALSDRHVARLVANHSFEDNLNPATEPGITGPEFYETFLGDVILPSDPVPFESWYEPSDEDVTAMVGYVDPISCSGEDTGTMEVLLKIHFYVERHQTTYKPNPFTGWTYSGNTLVVIQEVAWRYIS